MAAISGANPIVASDVNNFTGELFKITPHRTPLLAAAGGLNGGNAIKHKTMQLLPLLLLMMRVDPQTIQVEAERHNRVYYRFFMKPRKYLILHKQLQAKSYRLIFQGTTRTLILHSH
jgi:hypothetical protein